ncbi:hypothetical protein CURE108131_22980 [Cupriavidus respiraculi]|uniref:Uncharacterized protein n=1 Tax=Cupriavidus respiraculi TaxID=195930 RepID=A0ABM8WY73_9BURK|nr:hypothetical protein [Cupriavidus respiraculi]CAG9172521.1 hypothetical protein LMG21510_01999 [Cupriavidus respiraculi]
MAELKSCPECREPTRIIMNGTVEMCSRCAWAAEVPNRAAPADKQGGGLTDAEAGTLFRSTAAKLGADTMCSDKTAGAFARAVLARVAPSDQIVTALQDIKENASKWHPLHTPQSSEQQAERVTDCSTADCQCDECSIGRGDWAPVSEQPAEEARGVVLTAEQAAEIHDIMRACHRWHGGDSHSKERRERAMALLAAPAAATAQDYEAVLADHRRLVRELDVLLNGDAAAKQASLCDIVAQVRRGGIKAATGAQGLTPEQIAMVAAPYIRPVQRGMFAQDLAAALAASQPHGGKERG